MRVYYCIFFFFPISGCYSAFDQIADGYYYIGNETTINAVRNNDWFTARRDCWNNVSNLVSVETSEELTALEEYIVSRGYPNGSTFATSGHNFYSDPPYSWEGAGGMSVNLTRWAPGCQVVQEKSYIRLILINTTLYISRSYGNDDYYICERRISPHQLWLSLEPSTKTRMLLYGYLACFTVLLMGLRMWWLKRKCNQCEKDADIPIPYKKIQIQLP